MALTSHEARQLNRLIEKSALADEYGRRRRVMTQEAAVRYRPFRRQRREIRDYGSMGLYLIIQPSGHKSWAMRFRKLDGRPCKLTLGPLDHIDRELRADPVVGMPLTLSAARVLATKIHRERKMGLDVLALYRRKRRLRLCH